MADVVKRLEVAEIRGANWFSLWMQMFKVFIRMVSEANKRRKDYPKGMSPWSSKVIYFGMNIRLALKQEEGEI